MSEIQNENTQPLKKILEQVASISKKYEAIYEADGSKFNIFSIAGIETDEVRICKIIKELIDPKGAHYQGSAYLRLFVEHVLDISDEISDEEYKKSGVYTEDSIDNQRRIDIFIMIGKYEIPIEVKINAGDQVRQCSDYKKKAKNSPLYYLTLDGHPPSKKSAEGLTPIFPPDTNPEPLEKEPIGYEDVELISFKYHIIMWLEKCLTIPCTIRIAPIREILIQLINNLKVITNQLEDNMRKEIIDVIKENAESLESAAKIESAFLEVKQDIIDAIFKKLDKEILKEIPKETISGEQSVRDENFKGDYTKKKQCENGQNINYILCPYNEQAGVFLCFRVEFYYGIFSAGFVIDDNGKSRDGRNADEIAALSTIGSRNANQCWYHVVEFKKKSDPNFKSYNPAFCKLATDKGLELFIKEAMNRINDLLKCYNPVP
ncbi:hypothetical protein AGMMS49983_15650 [Clostridia bacterium]|nr:hypothetical protein AGMMS49983_15650 [Clostridia bacterium]